jgi:hypothetical protein
MMPSAGGKKNLGRPSTHSPFSVLTQGAEAAISTTSAILHGGTAHRARLNPAFAIASPI